MELCPCVRVVKVSNGSDGKGEGINRYSEPEDNQTCCLVQSCCCMPMVRKKNIQSDFLTIIEGLGEDLVHENILIDLKKECRCEGKIVHVQKLGRVIKLEGDRERPVKKFLIREGLARPELMNDYKNQLK